MKLRRRFLRFLLAVTAIYGAVVALLMWQEPNLVYWPDRNGAASPEAARLAGFTKESLAQPNQSPVIYWEHHEPKGPIIVYFHGNGQGLYVFKDRLAYLAAQHFHVIAIEYPGFPGVEGIPNQTDIVADGVHLLTSLAKRYPNRPVVLWGYSLGTGVAVQVAAQQAPAAMVLESPFTAVTDVAALAYPWVPVQYLMRNSYRSRDLIAHIHAPLFIMHGAQDTIVPSAQGERLFTLANEPKTFKLYPEAGHFDLPNYGAHAEAIAFINTAVAPH